jgi:uncharacterized protein YuzE
MKIRVDEKADALYLRLDDSKIVDSKEAAPGVVLDYDASNRVVGIELLHLSKRTPKPNRERGQVLPFAYPRLS